MWDSGKVLGMIYSVEQGDVFTYSSKFKNVSEIVEVKDGKWTKRNVCKASASIFDPLGLISPFVVRSRVIMQEIWKQKIDWDTVIPIEIQQNWKEWLDQVFAIPDIKIPRWSGIKTKTQHYQIHTFCDASQEGYCVAVYIRIKEGKQISTNLLTAKSRVSPLKAESISRQELIACVLAIRLTSVVQETYPATVDNTFYWTDSEVCLHWINVTAKSFKAFVAHRIGEIQNHTEPRQWLHVPTAQNPADIGTRPITAEELKENKMWWEGPEFLRKPVNEWPKSKVVRQVENTELRQTIFVTTTPMKKAIFVDCFEKFHPSHYSVGTLSDGYRKCVLKWSTIMKAVNRFKGIKNDDAERISTPNEVEIGLRFLIRQAQIEFFEQEIKLMSVDYKPLAQCAFGIKSSIMQFNPFLDEFGVMRSWLGSLCFRHLAVIFNNF